MVKKVFAFAFVGITTAASITGIVLTNSDFKELKAADNALTMTFTPSNNDLVINVSLPDLDYEKDGTTEVYIDTITVSYVC